MNKILKAFCVLFGFATVAVSANAFVKLNTVSASNNKVSLTSIASANNLEDGNKLNQVCLKFNDADSTITVLNSAADSFKDQIKYNNYTFNQLGNDYQVKLTNARLYIWYPRSIIQNGDVITIEDGANIGGIYFSEVKVVLSDFTGEYKWYDSINFQGIDENANHTLFSGWKAYYALYLNFDKNVNTINANVGTTIPYIYVNGQPVDFIWQYAIRNGDSYIGTKKLGLCYLVSEFSTKFAATAQYPYTKLEIKKGYIVAASEGNQGLAVNEDLVFYFIDGKWTYQNATKEVNPKALYNNHTTNGGDYFTSFTFDNSISGTNSTSELYSHMTINGEAITEVANNRCQFAKVTYERDTLYFFCTPSVFDNFVSEYTGGKYPIPTIEIEEFTFTHPTGVKYHVNPVTYFMVNNQWTTTCPYYRFTFNSINETYNNAKWDPWSTVFNCVYVQLNNIDHYSGQLINKLEYTINGSIVCSATHGNNSSAMSTGGIDGNYHLAPNELGLSYDIFENPTMLNPTEDYDVTTLEAGGFFLDTNNQVFLEPFKLYLNPNTQKWQSTPVDFYTSYGVDIRKESDGTGVKFTSNISYDYYQSLVKKYSVKGLEIGTFIAPLDTFQSYHTTFREFVTNNQPSSSTYIKVGNWDKGFVNLSTAKSGDYLTYYGSLTNLKDITRNFIGVGYIRIRVTNELILGSYNVHGDNAMDIAMKYYEAGDISYVKALGYYMELEEGATSYSLSDITEGKNLSSYSYSLTYDKQGYYKITTGAKKLCFVIVNNKVRLVSIPTNSSKYIKFDGENLHIENSVKQYYGFAEPGSDLYGENITATNTQIAAVDQGFNAKSQRIWAVTSSLVQTSYMWNDPTSPEFESASGPYIYSPTVMLRQSYADKIHAAIAQYRAAGVERISLFIHNPIFDMSGITNTYCDGKWVTVNQALSSGKSYVLTSSVPTDTEEHYNHFKALQANYIDLIAQEFGDEIDAFEMNNEPEGGMWNKTNPQYSWCQEAYTNQDANPDLTKMARIAMDLCKIATASFRKYNKDVEVLSPAFTTVERQSISDGVSTTDLLNACYNYISSQNGKPNDYFQALNAHPYLMAAPIENKYAYLFEKSDRLWYRGKYQNSTYINYDYVTEWPAYVEMLRTIMRNNGDDKKPLWITEFGFHDDWNDSSSVYYNFRDSQLLQDVMTNLTNSMKGFDYLEAVTMYRMFDVATVDKGPGSFGFISRDGTLKPIGQFYYRFLNNGSTTYSNVTDHTGFMGN